MILISYNVHWLYGGKSDNQVKALELKFEKENYQHLPGIESIDKNGNVREHVAELFYYKCLNNQSAKEEIQFKKYSTIRYAAKELNLNNLTIPNHIMEKIILGNYVLKK